MIRIKKKTNNNSETDFFREYLSWIDIENLIDIISNKIRKGNKKYDTIIGIKNGGIVPARLISRELEINEIEFISTKSVETNEFCHRIKNNKNHRIKNNKKYLLIDEIYDTGKTFLAIKEGLKNIEYDFTCLISRYRMQDDNIIVGRVLNNTNWIVFPWESRNIK